MSTRPVIRGTFGATASTHWLATAAGMAVLERGGNAFDAAVATGLTLHVVEPHLNGLGGDTPVVFHDAATNETLVLCGQGVAPSAATIDHFQDLGLTAIPGTGHLAAVVPGSFGAWMELLRRGRLSLRDVMEPAIGFARTGYQLVPKAVETIAAVADHLRAHWPTSAEVYLPDGRVPQVEQRFRNLALADTLERLLREAEASGRGDREREIGAARRAFYEGFVAEAIDAFMRVPVRDSSNRDHAGLLTGADLARWRAQTEQPVVGRLGEHEVVKPGPWSQGPVMLLQLRLLEQVGVADLMDDAVNLIHTTVEAAKLAFADRDAWFADPAFCDVPLAALLSADVVSQRAALIADEASAELRPTELGDGQSARDRLLRNLRRSRDAGDAGSPGLGEPTVRTDGVTKGDTCHVDVVDRWGNLVSATPSGGWLQSSPVVPGLGLSVSTRAQMFWLDPEHPSALAPGKRPRTTLSPGLVARDGVPVLAYGTPGGDQQDQWTVPFLLRYLTGRLDLQAAIDAPAWHTTHLISSFDPRTFDPRGVHVESRVGQDVVDALERRGHRVTTEGPWTLGRISAAGIEGEFLVAAANARGAQGYAAGR